MTQRQGPVARSLLLICTLCTALWLGAVGAMAVPTAAIVVDARTGQVLYENNADARLHPASLTKMLTLYIAFDAIRRGEISLDTMVTVSAKAAAEPPSRLGLRSGQRISMRHLIRAAALKSGNDAATAIAEAISGSEAAFAQRMTRTAKALGMTRSQFRNAHGLTAEGHLSTARDMNLLGRRLFHDFPTYYPLFARRTEDAGIARVQNTNSRFLDGYPGADGIKTGYTRAAGFNLTASAEQGGKRIVATVFGGSSTAQRTARMAELMNIGFGKAPARVRNQPPPTANLDAVASAAAGAVAAAAEQPASQSGARAGAAKTVRVSFAMQTSPRPMRRPDPAAEADAIAAITGDVAGLLAELTQEDTPAEDPRRPVARAETIPFQIVQDQTPVPNDQEATQQDLAAALTAEEPAKAVAAAMQPPRARPEGLASEKTAQDTAPEVPAVETAQAAVVPEQMAEVPDDAAEPHPLDLAEAEDLPIPRGEEPEAVPELVQMTASLRSPETAFSGPNRPSPRPGEIVMTSARMPAADSVPAASGQVVTRLSTSGGRHWAVNIGSFPNRGAAERALLQTALSETRTLSSALRKVSQRSGKWEANFAGLTQEEADMACRRLQSRAITCFTLGP